MEYDWSIFYKPSLILSTFLPLYQVITGSHNPSSHPLFVQLLTHRCMCPPSLHVLGQANRNTKLRDTLQKPKGNLPLLQFAVNEILSLVGRGVCRKCQEVADVFERQALQKLVCNCKSLPRASGTDAKNLEAQPAVPAEGNAGSCPSRAFKRSERREGLLFH